MKTTGIFVSLFILSFCLMGCKTKIQYVPVESVRLEYKDNYLRDSIYRYDSVYVKEKGDTVWVEKLRYIYKDKLVKDSILIQDTIPVPYEVEKIVKEKYVSSLQNFQIWCGRILLLLLIVYFGFKLIKRRIRF